MIQSKEIDEKGLDSSLFNTAKTTITLAKYMKDHVSTNQECEGKMTWGSIVDWYGKNHGDETSGDHLSCSEDQFSFVNNVISRMIRHDKALIEVVDGREITPSDPLFNGHIELSKTLKFNSNYRINETIIRDLGGKKKQKKHKTPCNVQIHREEVS